MATKNKKTAQSKKSGVARSGKKSAATPISPETSLSRTLVGVLFLAVITLAGMAIIPRWIAPTPPEKIAAPPKPTLPPPPVVRPRQEIPTYEVFNEDIELNPPEEPMLLPQVPEGTRPRVAIIFDDMGYHKKNGKRLLDLDAPLTFAVLPSGPNRNAFAEAAHAKGRELMLHMPMEPMEYPRVDPGPGALLRSMDPDVLIAQLEENLAAVPYIIGVNNHMGSRLTTESTQMYQIFSILKKKKLFFIDSRTHAKSVCRPSARLLRIRFAERDVFLDHVQDADAVQRQIDKLIAIARKKGHAIGIGHPHTVTVNVLESTLPKLKSAVRLVPVSELVHPVG